MTPREWSVRNALETLRRRCEHIRQRMNEHPTTRWIAEKELAENERAIEALRATPVLTAFARAHAAVVAAEDAYEEAGAAWIPKGGDVPRDRLLRAKKDLDIARRARRAAFEAIPAEFRQAERMEE